MPNLVSGVAQMVAGSVVRLPMDFGNEPRLVAGAEVVDGELVLATNIDEYTVTCADSGAPAVSGEQLDYPYQVSAEFSGGTARQAPYNVVFTITLDDEDATVIRRVALLQVL